MHLFHIATAADWSAALPGERYTTSTLGRSLAEEGFIHAARAEQVRSVFDAHYRSVAEPLVLLTIDTDRLEPAWREEPVAGATYPHILGALNTSAVVRVAPLTPRGRPDSLTRAFTREMLLRSLLAVAAMLLAALGAAVGGRLGGDWGPFLGAVVGLGTGAVAGVLALRRRR